MRKITDFQFRYGGKRPRQEFTQIPTVLIRELKALMLSPKELVVLCYILSYAFMLEGENSTVSVSLREMGKLTGLSTATIHSAKKMLVFKGFIAPVEVRNQDRTATFDIAPLEAKLSRLPFADEQAVPEPEQKNEGAADAPDEMENDNGNDADRSPEAGMQ